MNSHPLATVILVAFSMMSEPDDLNANPEGALSKDLLIELRDNFRMDDIDRARFNAVSNSDINKLRMGISATGSPPRGSLIRRPLVDAGCLQALT